MFRLSAIVGVAWVGSLAGCGDPTGLGRPDPSLDPSDLVVGGLLATPCAFTGGGDRIQHLRDRHEWAFVDIYFGRPSGVGPTRAELALVARHGGRTIHEFNVPAARAHMMLSRAPDLVQQGDWITVREVPDPSRYDVPGVSVGFARPLRASDLHMLERLGARVGAPNRYAGGLSMTIPDRSIPVLRDLPHVTYVEVSGVACII